MLTEIESFVCLQRSRKGFEPAAPVAVRHLDAYICPLAWLLRRDAKNSVRQQVMSRHTFSACDHAPFGATRVRQQTRPHLSD